MTKRCFGTLLPKTLVCRNHSAWFCAHGDEWEAPHSCSLSLWVRWFLPAPFLPHMLFPISYHWSQLGSQSCLLRGPSLWSTHWLLLSSYCANKTTVCCYSVASRRETEATAEDVFADFLQCSLWVRKIFPTHSTECLNSGFPKKNTTIVTWLPFASMLARPGAWSVRRNGFHLCWLTCSCVKPASSVFLWSEQEQTVSTLCRNKSFRVQGESFSAPSGTVGWRLPSAASCHRTGSGGTVCT